MPPADSRWSVCPVEDCSYAIEYDPDEGLFCPSCEMELISECPTCKFMIQTEEQSLCGKCGAPLRE